MNKKNTNRKNKNSFGLRGFDKNKIILYFFRYKFINIIKYGINIKFRLQSNF
jgi:hypothetical protein